LAAKRSVELTGTESIQALIWLVASVEHPDGTDDGTVTRSAGVVTVQVRVAGEESTLPAAASARTLKLCEATLRPL
jgi:hypothetical protein